MIIALLGKKVDITPVASFTSVVMTDIMEASKTYLPEAHQDPRMMASLAGAAHEYAGLVTVNVPFDLTVEAEALGCEVDLGDALTPPRIKKSPYEDSKELQISEDFMKRGRIPVVLSSIEFLKKMYQTRVLVVSSITGPFTIASFLKIRCKPEDAYNVLDLISDVCVEYGRELLFAGADVITVREPASWMLTLEGFKNLVKPYLEKFSSKLPGLKVLHTCGDTRQILSEMINCGFNALSLNIDIKSAREIVGKDVVLVGGVPPAALERGTFRDLQRAAAEAITHGVNVLAPGCDLSLRTPLENLRSLPGIVVTHYTETKALQKLEH